METKWYEVPCDSTDEIIEAKEAVEADGVLVAREVARKMGFHDVQRYVFEPRPQKAWTMELIGMIPEDGHELDVPKEFSYFPYAAYEWQRVMKMNKTTKVITPEKREVLYSYCLMVERRKRCLVEWNGAIVTDGKTKATVRLQYLGWEIDRLGGEINRLGAKLGLFPRRKAEKRTVLEKCEEAREEYVEDFDYGEESESELEERKDGSNDDLFD